MSINQDRPCTCMFFFADGRRCQMPPSADPNSDPNPTHPEPIPFPKIM